MYAPSETAHSDKYYSATVHSGTIPVCQAGGSALQTDFQRLSHVWEWNVPPRLLREGQLIDPDTGVFVMGRRCSTTMKSATTSGGAAESEDSAQCVIALQYCDW